MYFSSGVTDEMNKNKCSWKGAKIGRVFPHSFVKIKIAKNNKKKRGT